MAPEEEGRDLFLVAIYVLGWIVVIVWLLLANAALSSMGVAARIVA